MSAYEFIRVFFNFHYSYHFIGHICMHNWTPLACRCFILVLSRCLPLLFISSWDINIGQTLHPLGALARLVANITLQGCGFTYLGTLHCFAAIQPFIYIKYHVCLLAWLWEGGNGGVQRTCIQLWPHCVCMQMIYFVLFAIFMTCNITCELHKSLGFPKVMFHVVFWVLL
jgi:hypothetical protein